MRAHRCTVEQLAILEPALSETLGTKFALALREATDEAVGRGGPKPAVIDFIIGHLTIELAIAFGSSPRASSRTAPPGDRQGQAGYIPRRVDRRRLCSGGCAQVVQRHLQRFARVRSFRPAVAP
jgi:hypothetical protein